LLFLGAQRRQRRSRNFRGDVHGGFGHQPPSLGQSEGATAAVGRVGCSGYKGTCGEAVDHALDGGGVEADQPAEVVLRAGPDLVELGERRELRLCQPLDHARGENRGVTLHRDAQQKADLLVEFIAARCGRVRDVDDFQFPAHFQSHSAAPAAQVSQDEK
jgi:hypothetical protein